MRLGTTTDLHRLVDGDGVATRSPRLAGGSRSAGSSAFQGGTSNVCGLALLQLLELGVIVANLDDPCRDCLWKWGPREGSVGASVSFGAQSERAGRGRGSRDKRGSAVPVRTRASAERGACLL